MLFNERISSDEARKRLYGIKKILDSLDNEEEQNISDVELLDKLEIKKINLQKERYKLQTEKLEVNQWVRDLARFELFEEKMIKAIANNLGKLKIPNYIKPKMNDELISPILGFADTHYGADFKVTGLKGEILNEYNIEVFEKRMWDLLDETVKILEKEKLNHINVFNLNDSIEGILRISQLQKLKLGIIDSTIGFWEFLLNWLNELSHYAIIDYYASETGNHSEIRPLGTKKGEFPSENMERVITYFLYRFLDGNTNIRVHKNVHPLCFTKINGYNILAGHGDNDKDLEKSIKDYILLYGEKIDYFITGHKHHGFVETVGMTENGNIDAIRLPSIVGLDRYSESLKKAAKPGAKMMLLQKGKGKVVTYDINLG